MYEEITQLKGKEKGTTSIVLVGVHGDEKCGVKAFENILPTLVVERGTVMFGYGNPRAIKANKRFVEANLNRMFKDESQMAAEVKQSYEYQRAQFLKDYLNKADALLDIHASSIPDSRTFVICETNAYEIVKYFPVDLVVSGFDKVEPGGTDYCMNSKGKIGICLECGYMKSPQAVEVAEEGIMAFLKARGHIRNDLTRKTQSYVQMFKKYFAKTDKFSLSRPFENFETVTANQVVGTDGQEKVKAPKKSLILFAQDGAKIGDEVFLLGEDSS